MLFKHEYDKQRFEDLCDPLKYLAHEMDFYFTVNGMKMVVTCTWTTPLEDKVQGRKEKSHQEKRSIDIRAKDVPRQFREEVLTRFSMAYRGWGAIGRDSGLEKLIVLHGSEADGSIHFHVQLRKDWSKIKIPKELIHGKAATLHWFIC